VNFVADVENIRRKVIFTPKTNINSIEQQKRIAYWRWRVKLNTLKEIANEMMTFVVLTILVSTVLAISTLFGSGLTITTVLLPTIFGFSVTTVMVITLGFWIFYNYCFYVFDRMDKKNES
tara:strand:- start:137 stop:496 length:360 start_codon:yes stop_codon:yes gene_type:complete